MKPRILQINILSLSPPCERTRVIEGGGGGRRRCDKVLEMKGVKKKKSTFRVVDTCRRWSKRLVHVLSVGEGDKVADPENLVNVKHEPAHKHQQPAPGRRRPASPGRRDHHDASGGRARHPGAQQAAAARRCRRQGGPVAAPAAARAHPPPHPRRPQLSHVSRPLRR